MEGISSIASQSAINETLSKIRAISQQTSVFKRPEIVSPDKSNFGSILTQAKNSIHHVSDAQNSTDALKQAYLTGDPNTSVSQVMVASVKSKIAFEGLVAVRNKFLDAYKEIMNMPI